MKKEFNHQQKLAAITFVLMLTMAALIIPSFIKEGAEKAQANAMKN